MAEATIPTHRDCTKCGQIKPLQAFHRHKLGKHGRNPVCRECKSYRGGVDDFLSHGSRQPTEGWQPVLGYEGYYSASVGGEIRSEDRVIEYADGRKGLYLGQIIRPYIGQNGYPYVRLSRNGKTRLRTVHSLVAEAFLGPRPAGLDVAHNDGDYANPAALNLRYASRAENMADKLLHGTDTRGENSPASRLTRKQVETIRSEIDVSANEMAARFKVNVSTIYAVRRGRSWALPSTDRPAKAPSLNYIPRALRREVHQRAAGKCYYCGAKAGRMHVDHFIPLKRGGTTCAENLLLACPRCNCGKGAKMPWEMKAPRLI